MININRLNISLIDARNKGGMPYFRLKVTAVDTDGKIYADEFPIFKSDCTMDKILKKIEQFRDYVESGPYFPDIPDKYV